MLLATAVYTFIRLLEDHEAPPFKNLRQMEIEFCSSLLRERVWSNKATLYQNHNYIVTNDVLISYSAVT